MSDKMFKPNELSAFMIKKTQLTNGFLNSILGQIQTKMTDITYETSEIIAELEYITVLIMSVFTIISLIFYFRRIRLKQ